MKNVNDKYRYHYKNIDMKNQYNKDKRDYSWLLYLASFFMLITPIIFFGIAVATSSSNEAENNKDKFIEIKRNSLGCVQYRYNQDKVWKCPKDMSISQIEKRVCSGGKINTCRTEYEPVIN